MWTPVKASWNSQNKTKQNKSKTKQNLLLGSQSLKRSTEDQGSIHLSCGSHNLWHWPKKTRTAYFSPDIWGLCWPHMLYISSGVLGTCQLEGFSCCFRISEGLVTGEVSEMPWWHLLFQLGFFTFLFFFLILFIYFWLHWLFIAVHGLSLVAESRSYSSLRCAGFSCCGARALGMRSSVVVARGLSSCGTRA